VSARQEERRWWYLESEEDLTRWDTLFACLLIIAFVGVPPYFTDSTLIRWLAPVAFFVVLFVIAKIRLEMTKRALSDG
jgi:hypothetical protein